MGGWVEREGSREKGLVLSFEFQVGSFECRVVSEV